MTTLKNPNNCSTTVLSHPQDLNIPGRGGAVAGHLPTCPDVLEDVTSSISCFLDARPGRISGLFVWREPSMGPCTGRFPAGRLAWWVVWWWCGQLITVTHVCLCDISQTDTRPAVSESPLLDSKESRLIWERRHFHWMLFKFWQISSLYLESARPKYSFVVVQMYSST